MSYYDYLGEDANPDYDDLAFLLDEARTLIHLHSYDWHYKEGVPMESMDSVDAELNFLYTFLAYTHNWSDAASSSSSSSSSSSQNNYTNRDSLFIKVVAAAKELERYLQLFFIDRFTHQPRKLTTQLVNFGISAMNPFRSKRSELLHVFTTLNQKIALLKPQIREAYLGSLSTLPIHPQPPSYVRRNYDWGSFYHSVWSSLRYLSKEKSLYLGDPLRMQMKAFWQTFELLHKLLTGHSYDNSAWKDNMVAHFGRMVVQVAHLCCLCWYNPPVDQTWQQDIAISLSDLHHKMNPASPGFLEVALGFLGGQWRGEDSEKSISSFIYHILILGVQDKRELLHKEFEFLLTCLVKIQEMHDLGVHRILVVGINDVVMEARYLEGKDRRKHKTNYAILFANIWLLKAEIFIKSSGTLTLSKDNHVEALYEGYRFLEQIFSPTDEQQEEYQILKCIEGVPKQVQSLYQSSPDEDYLVHTKVSNLLFKSLVQIKLLKAKAFLQELLKKAASLMFPLKHKTETLHEGLFFLLETVINETKENIEDEKLILTDIEVVATRVISLCNTSPTDNLTEEEVKNMDISLLDLLEKVQHLMPKLKGLYVQIPRHNLPKTPRLCFIELLLQNLRHLLNCEHDSVAHAAHHIEVIYSDLEFIVSTFPNVFEQGIEKQECKDFYTQLADIAYQVEHVIDSMLVENKAVWHHSLWLYQVSEEIRHIKMQLVGFDGNNTYADGFHNVRQRLMPEVSQVTSAIVEEVMVGLSDQKETIIGRLTRGTLQRGVVSIVGMSGLGKTTLANNVFCSLSVMHHFPIRAWCCVSQRYKKRDLLFDILSHIITITDNTHAMSDADLDLLLYKQLKGKRYLIVMDDMWSTRAWEDLQLSFPDDSNGSRILLTSRLQDVILKISDPHPLRPLSEEESWELLKVKIFGEEECPKELLEVGQQIAKNCKGLPLAIGAIAGLLDRTCGKRQDLWKHTAESVSSRIVQDPETQCKKILELSYNHLPDHLKACLLYFGAFPEDKDIPVSRLQWLWIAEGFVHHVGNKILEDLAEDYLMDLVGRSLVIVAKRKSNGKVKACRVHDVVRDLCLLRAKDDGFLQPISGDDEPYSFFDDLDRGVPLELFHTSNSTTYEEYRLCFFVNREHFVVSRPSGPFVRSLLFFATIDMYPRCPYDVSFIYDNYKRLRVLDLESINLSSSLENGIEQLVDLRYLAVCGDMESIPPSLSNLGNLETLLVKGLKTKVILPETIWRMTKLRHIHVTNCALFTLHHTEGGSYSHLPSLMSLSFPCFTCGEAANDMIMRFPNLRKLRCIALEPRDVSVNFCRFLALESLCKLESLKISYSGMVLNVGELQFPSSIKKLTLSGFRLPWSHISAIGGLHNLEILKLISRAFEGSRWHMIEGEFVNLKYLNLDTLNIVHWDASSDHLPQLQQLVVRNCKQLEEIPFDFVSIPTLQKIEVQQCGTSVVESVRRIEEVEIEGLKIVINNSHSA